MWHVQRNSYSVLAGNSEGMKLLEKSGVDELNIEMHIRCAGPQYDVDEVGTIGGLFERVHGPSVYTKCEKILDHLKGC